MVSNRKILKIQHNFLESMEEDKSEKTDSDRAKSMLERYKPVGFIEQLEELLDEKVVITPQPLDTISVDMEIVNLMRSDVVVGGKKLGMYTLGVVGELLTIAIYQGEHLIAGGMVDLAYGLGIIKNDDQNLVYVNGGITSFDISGFPLPKEVEDKLPVGVVNQPHLFRRDLQRNITFPGFKNQNTELDNLLLTYLENNENYQKSISAFLI